MHALERFPHMDVSLHDEVPEVTFENHKLLLIIGKTLGWADRFMASLQKTSASVLVDAGTYEWFYPLLHEGVHYVRADANVASVVRSVEWGLANDEKLHKIAQAGRAYAEKLYTLEHMAMYVAAVARGYAHVVDVRGRTPPAGLVPASEVFGGKPYTSRG